MLRQAIRTVRDAQRLVREGEALWRELGRVLAVPAPRQAEPQPRRKGHPPGCRHCSQVEDYRLARDSQLRYAESLACGDEEYRPVTFREWLVQEGRERRVIGDEEWAAEWS